MTAVGTFRIALESASGPLGAHTRSVTAELTADALTLRSTHGFGSLASTRGAHRIEPGTRAYDLFAGASYGAKAGDHIAEIRVVDGKISYSGRFGIREGGQTLAQAPPAVRNAIEGLLALTARGDATGRIAAAAKALIEPLH